jgi:hypothetical protein
MAVLQIQAAPFFASKNRAFWNLQLAGWGAAFLLRAVSALANEQPFDLLALVPCVDQQLLLSWKYSRWVKTFLAKK